MSSSKLNPRLTTLLLSLLIFGYPLVTTLFLPNGGERSAAVSRVVTVPFRAIVLGLSLTLIAMNWKRRIRLNLPLRLYFLFWFLLSLRIIYDLFIRTDIIIDPSIIQNMILYSYFVCLLPTIAIVRSLKNVNYDWAFKWMLRGMFLMIPFLAVKSPYLFSTADVGRVWGNIALNPISFGVCGATMAIFGLYVMERTGWGWRRWFGAVLMAIGVLILLRSGSRGPLVAFISSIIFYAIARLNNSVWVILSSFGLAVFIILNDIIFEMIGRISPVMAQRLTLSGNVSQYEEFTNARSALFSQAIDKFVNHPLFGDAYALVFPNGTIAYSHNSVLDAFMALGLFGGCLFVMILLFAIRNSFILIRHRHRFWWIGLLCICYLVIITMKLLLITNFASHYRSAIYQLIDQEFEADFVFGDKVGDIKPMNYQMLTHQVSIVHNVSMGRGYYQQGVLKYLVKDYDTYLMAGEFRCISTWLMLLCLRLMPRKRSYLWTHGWLGKERGLKRMLTFLFFWLADGVFVYNCRSRNLMVEGGVPSRKVVTLYNSLDYDLQLSLRKSLSNSEIYRHHFGNDGKVIIFVGRLTSIKRLDLVLEAMSLSRCRGENYNFVLVGDGEARKSLEALTIDWGLKEQVWFYGACYDEKTIAEMIYNADVCVSPGNIGLTAMHVLMYGCPAITNDDFNHQMPEFEAIKPGETGEFFESDNPKALADVIVRWFRTNKNRRELIRNNCYEEIDKYWNPHYQIDALVDCLTRKMKK